MKNRKARRSRRHLLEKLEDRRCLSAVSLFEPSRDSGDGTWDLQQRAGTDVYVGSKYLYYNVDQAASLPGFQTGDLLYAKVNYFDEGTGRIRVQYDSVDGNEFTELHTNSDRSDTQEFVASSHALVGAELNGQLVGYDLRVETNGVPVVSVEISDEPFADGGLDYVESPPWEMPYSGPTDRGADAATLDGKVLVGYQGWFRTPNDARDLGFRHWGKPGDWDVDQWPDPNDYDPSELYAIPGETTQSGDQAYLYSSLNESVVRRHFQWMREHNIDGVLQQRFNRVTKNADGSWNYDHWAVRAGLHGLPLVREAANLEGRTWAIEYDIQKGGSPEGNARKIKEVKDDWEYLTRADGFDMLSDPSYQRHDGKPVVAIYGLYVTPDNHYSDADQADLVNWFKSRGVYVIGAGRHLNSTHQIQNNLALYDDYMQWQGYWTGQDSYQRDVGLAAGITRYVPHVLPGFSWTHLKEDADATSRDRDGGAYYQRMLADAVNETDAPWIFIGMFDEYDEATNITPASDDPPVPDTDASGDTLTFQDNEGRPNDWHMALTGKAREALLGRESIGDALPSEAELENRSNVGAEVRWQFGSEEGLQIASAGDGDYLDWQQDGVSGVITVDPYLYFQVDDAFMFDALDGQDITVEVEYLDVGTRDFRLQYNSTTSNYTSTPRFARTDTGQWLTKRFELSDAVFRNAQNSQSDFRLHRYTDNLVVRSVRVIKEAVLSVSADLGVGGTTNGLSNVDTVGDGNVTYATVDGRNVISLDGSSSQKYAYFRIDDDFFHEVHAGLNAIVEVTYKDDGNEDLDVQYHSTERAYDSVASIGLSDTGQWRRGRFYLTDAFFGNGQNGGSDFRLTGTNIAIDSVRVLRQFGDIFAPEVESFTVSEGVTADTYDLEWLVADEWRQGNSDQWIPTDLGSAELQVSSAGDGSWRTLAEFTLGESVYDLESGKHTWSLSHNLDLASLSEESPVIRLRMTDGRGNTSVSAAHAFVDETPSSLAVGESLAPGQFLESDNGQYRLNFQGDGNVVLREVASGDSLWSTGTHNQGGTNLVLQSDGNLVLYTPAGTALWDSATNGTAANVLTVDNGGTVTLYAGSDPLWSRPTEEEPGEPPTNSLATGESLSPDESLESENGQYRLNFQGDGNVVLREVATGDSLWSTGTHGQGGTVLVLQGDGNLVQYTDAGTPLWDSATNGTGADTLTVQNDGTLTLTLGSTVIWSVPSVDPGPGPEPEPERESLTLPLRGAFYYPWYPQTWTVQGERVFYEPDLGYYSSDDPAVVDQHIDELDYAKVDVAIASWWGPGAQSEDTRVPMLLNQTVEAGSDLKWAMYYEDEGFGDPSVATLRADLQYLADNYTDHEAYAYVDGKPVIFVYNADDPDCEVADRWAEAAGDDWYVQLKVFGGFRGCASQPDSWHQYGPGSAVSQHDGYSYAITPGFWRADQAEPLLERDIDRWEQNVTDMIASAEPWQLITTYNEWGEGTAVESARNWPSASGYGQYLDALHFNGDVPDTGSDPSSLAVGESLLSNQYLESDNGQYRLYLQGDGNVVLRELATGNSLWSTGTHGQDGTRLSLQSDGDLVLYTATETPVWSTGTAGSGATALTVGDNGTVTLYAGTNALWSRPVIVDPPPPPPPPDDGAVTIAFIGDQGWESAGQYNGPRAVLQMIEAEGADAVMHQGDFDYRDDPDAWEDMINDELGTDFPYFVSVGNHDEAEWYGSGGYQERMEDRLRAQGIQWEGELGVTSTINFQGIFMVFAAPGIYGSHSANANYLSSQLANDPSIWSICSWHKNQRQMQVGGKSDEAGWEVYEACREAGGIIATGHEHSYSRTHLLSDMEDRTVVTTSDTFEITDGETFAFVSGLGGQSVREQQLDGDWWASIYTATQGATHGALFGRFGVNGEEDLAHFYFKDIDGNVVDEFYVRSAVSTEVNPGGGGAIDGNTLDVGESMQPGDYIESDNEQYRLNFQSDGNVVLREVSTGNSLWSSGTHNEGGSRLVLQSDGNLVLYTATGSPVWATGTHGSNANALTLEDNGTLVLYEGGSALWSRPEQETPSGRVDGTQGTFSWNGTQVDYVSVGGLTNGGVESTPANSGDYEIVAFGASHGSGSGKVNEYFDESLMISQGFLPIEVRGEEDRKVELWIRQNTGQSTIDIPDDARAYAFLAIDGNDISINLGDIDSDSVRDAGGSYDAPSVSGQGMKVLSYFSDDSVELTEFGGGILLFQDWGFGDGDGFAMVLFAPGVSVPGTIGVDNHDPGGRQYVGVLANFNED